VDAGWRFLLRKGDGMDRGFKLSGWIFMIISLSSIIRMFIFCYSRIFRKGLDGEDSNTLKRIRK